MEKDDLEDIFGNFSDEEEEETKEKEDEQKSSSTPNESNQLQGTNNVDEQNKNEDDLEDIFGDISDEEEEEEMDTLKIPEYQKPDEDTVKIVKMILPKNVTLLPKRFEGSERKEYNHPVIAYRYLMDGDNFRVDENGEYVRESNTRIVSYSDGSKRLIIGKQSYDIVNKIARNKSSNLYCSDVNKNYYFSHGKINETWKAKGTMLFNSTGGKFSSETDSKFKRRTKLTDIKLQKEDLIDDKRRGRFNPEKEIQKMKKAQRRKTEKTKKKLNKDFLEEEDGDNISKIKKSHKRRKTGRKKKGGRGRKKKNKDEYEDDFVVEEIDDDDFDDDDDDEDEFDDDDEEVGNKRKRKELYSSEEEDEEIEFIQDMYEDESGSDSDETYRPGRPQKKKRKKRK